MRGAAADLCRVEKTRGRGGKLWLSGSVLAKGRVKLWLILGEEKGENPQNGRGGHREGNRVKAARGKGGRLLVFFGGEGSVFCGVLSFCREDGEPSFLLVMRQEN
jgi:hypothetical protein